MATEADIQAHILLTVADDADFRDRMIADPKATIEAETGGTLPEDQLVYIEQAIAAAQASAQQPLTVDELTQVAGGHCGEDEDATWCHNII